MEYEVKVSLYGFPTGRDLWFCWKKDGHYYAHLCSECAETYAGIKWLALCSDDVACDVCGGYSYTYSLWKYRPLRTEREKQ